MWGSRSITWASDPGPLTHKFAKVGNELETPINNQGGNDCVFKRINWLLGQERGIAWFPREKLQSSQGSVAVNNLWSRGVSPKCQLIVFARLPSPHDMFVLPTCFLHEWASQETIVETVCCVTMLGHVIDVLCGC